MYIYFQSRRDYECVHDALLEAFSIGFSAAQKGIQPYDEEGDETDEYMAALSEALSVEPVYDPDEIERIYSKRIAGQKAAAAMAKAAGDPDVDRTLPHLLASIERDKQNAYRAWETYLKQTGQPSSQT